jgi:hypothetical protein
MIIVAGEGGGSEAASLVLAALRRSVGRGQVVRRQFLEDGDIAGTAVLIASGDRLPAGLGEWLLGGARKLVVFGALPLELFDIIGLPRTDGLRPSPDLDLSESAPPHSTRESVGVVQYSRLAERLGGRAWRRPLRRYDFADEWNNLGYGAVTCDGSMWSLAELLPISPDCELAALTGASGARTGSYAALFDDTAFSILWFARMTGPVDSFEWCLVENFISSHRAEDLPVQPVLSEIPADHDAVVTMRLDCDEDIESARELWSAYCTWKVPFSLAVHTSLLSEGTQFPLLTDVLGSGGSILSHSATHARNWGGDYEAALSEARDSAERLERATGRRPRYAVSPFHQTPPYALSALAASGYKGCVGGNIAAHPAFNLARGGVVANLPDDFVGHTQQCMLHGDCLGDNEDPIAVYREAFDLAFESRSIFAYLDHPFSARYQYGWRDEQSRVDAHRMLLDHIAERATAPLYLSMDATLDFLVRKSQVEVTSTQMGYEVHLAAAAEDGPRLCAEYCGARIELRDGKLL